MDLHAICHIESPWVLKILNWLKTKIVAGLVVTINHTLRTNDIHGLNAHELKARPAGPVYLSS